MSTDATTIDWSQNCLTGGVHNGRQEEIWNIPLGYATQIFPKEALKDLVVARIYNDAMMLVQHGEGFTQDWADRLKAAAEEMYERTLQQKVGELEQYYKSHSFQHDILDAAERVERDKLNPRYAPLHHHDTINLLCRMIGVSSDYKAKKGE